MSESRALPNEPTGVYEIRLLGQVPASLRQRHPSVVAFTTPTETVLFRRVQHSSELDVLLSQLRSVGLVPSKVSEVQLAADTSPERLKTGGVS